MNESEFVDLIFDTINDSHGKLSIDEYKTIVLNLIFLKYLSDEFEKDIKNFLMKERDLKMILMSISLKIYFIYLLKHAGN